MAEITKEQEEYFDAYSCERLKNNINNQEEIKRFVNNKNTNIVNYFIEKAWEEDARGDVAYYVIKYNNEIIFFFSLKCGSLFDPLNEEELIERKKFLAKISDSTKKRQIRKYLQTTKKIKHSLELDKQKELNRDIYRVGSTYAGIELVHFCKNLNVKDNLTLPCLNHTLGEVLFWKFIVPIILKVQDSIGCKYIFLFAADSTENELLITYYRETLKFRQAEDISTSKPIYDFNCMFMCQSLSDLKENQKQCFENFNPDPDDQIV